VEIAVMDHEVQITLDSETERISFGGIAPISEDSREIPQQFYKLGPGERPEEYVITFEFDTGGRSRGTNLARLDASLKNVRLRLHDDGYVIEGDLTSWVAYTDAVTNTLR
jgi:hypothetical protein